MKKAVAILSTVVFLMLVFASVAFAAPATTPPVRNLNEVEPDNSITTVPVGNQGWIWYDAWYGRVASSGDIDFYKYSNYTALHPLPTWVAFELDYPSQYDYTMTFYNSAGQQIPGSTSTQSGLAYRSFQLSSSLEPDGVVYVKVFSPSGTYSNADNYMLGSFYGQWEKKK